MRLGTPCLPRYALPHLGLCFHATLKLISVINILSLAISVLMSATLVFISLYFFTISIVLML